MSHSQCIPMAHTTFSHTNIFFKTKGCTLNHFFLCARNQRDKENSTPLRFHLKEKLHLMVKLQLPGLEILYCTVTIAAVYCKSYTERKSTFFRSQEENMLFSGLTGA